ncbi:family 32 glycosyltransferase [Cryphonectria parasitica EP155]|uniref:Family 32 glycosyltransferase n=1 Tax=Cryphonectria parasitica (strain ATCC 38755 / EP155) TaxID=660469 RepID=A0A9P4XTF6_CRYP1|nr:family 32 glycosyltransferase [Cryphonectria parasitica EP155]KAF3760583.1 family 32 glycosyltransferase [Cryphonectria parasitica EP155]
MLFTTFSSLGSPLASPRLTAQFRNGFLPTSQIRRWAPYLAIICIFFFLAQVGLLGGRHADGQQHVQVVQNILGTPPSSSLPFAADAVSLRGNAPYARSQFPPKIWQTWKVDPLRFEERDLEKARSWTEKNPDWRYEVLTDGNDVRYVEYHYGPEGFNRPDIVAFYRDVTASIIKADLLRYLIMYAEGGVYADIDVEAMKPMSKFIPERYDHRDIDMVIGVEIDEPEWKDHPILGPKSRSFCQWTFMCKPQLPVMMRLVENIMHWLVDVANNQTVPLGDVVLDFDEVISGTGPSAFTNAIIAQMNVDRLSTPEITWDTFHDLDESKLVDRVLVLNVEAFAAGQGHSNSGTHDTRHSLVRHHYHASNWPSRHPRYSHPAYGQVEDCNWNKDCVHRWDEDVAAFAKLPEPEQQRIIDEKTKEREEKEAEERRKKEEKEREEEEARKKEDEERARVEEDERRKKEEEEAAAAGRPAPPAAEGDGDGPLPSQSRWFHSLFGYSVFCCAIFYILWANGCLSSRRTSGGPSLPMTEKV